MSYDCQASNDFGKTWDTKPIVSASSKAQIENWAFIQTSGSGLDWRVGFVFKFRNSQTQYRWVHRNGKKTGQEVKV